jgi:hypothetical protein
VSTVPAGTTLSPRGWYWDPSPPDPLPWPVRWWDGGGWTDWTLWWNGTRWLTRGTRRATYTAWTRRHTIVYAFLLAWCPGLGVITARVLTWAAGYTLPGGLWMVLAGTVLVTIVFAAIFTPVYMDRIRRPPHPPTYEPGPPFR